MNVIDTLYMLEQFLHLEIDSLLPLIDEDEIGGFHPDPTQAKWDVGAIWDVEGRVLYALIRSLKPLTVLEIGSGKGCSTTHIVTALAINDIGGHVTTIDRGNTPQVPPDLREYVSILSGDALLYLESSDDGSIDFILEDADHSVELCAAIGELAKTKLAPGGVLLAHDGAHFGVGADVRAGYDRAGLDFRVYLTEPSDCGWLVWQRPKRDVITLQQVIEVITLQQVINEASPIERAEIYAVMFDEPVLQAQETFEDVTPVVKIDNNTLETVTDEKTYRADLDDEGNIKEVYAVDDDPDLPSGEYTIKPVEKVKRTRKPKPKKAAK